MIGHIHSYHLHCHFTKEIKSHADALGMLDAAFKYVKSKANADDNVTSRVNYDGLIIGPHDCWNWQIIFNRNSSLLGETITFLCCNKPDIIYLPFHVRTYEKEEGIVDAFLDHSVRLGWVGRVYAPAKAVEQ